MKHNNIFEQRMKHIGNGCKIFSRKSNNRYPISRFVYPIIFRVGMNIHILQRNKQQQLTLQATVEEQAHKIAQLEKRLRGEAKRYQVCHCILYLNCNYYYYYYYYYYHHYYYYYYHHHHHHHHHLTVWQQLQAEKKSVQSDFWKLQDLYNHDSKVSNISAVFQLFHHYYYDRIFVFFCGNVLMWSDVYWIIVL